MSLKITPQEIENKIDKADYHRVGETTAIVCSLTLKSGFVVIGKAACFSHDIFDEQMGCELAYQDAIRHLWGLEAYRLKENAVMQKVEG